MNAAAGVAARGRGLCLYELQNVGHAVMQPFRQAPRGNLLRLWLEWACSHFVGGSSAEAQGYACVSHTTCMVVMSAVLPWL